MSVYHIDPLQDGRWHRFALKHPNASIFHTPAWLEALKRTYGFKPEVLTTSPPGHELANGLVFCRIASWLTGRRLVSLPFSDHCEPLLDREDSIDELLRTVKHDLGIWGAKCIEIRPVDVSLANREEFCPAKAFWLHKIDLRPNLSELSRAFHRDCVLRKIRRAEREFLCCEDGRSASLLQEFYRLYVLTRRRHGLVPQPLTWFRNLVECLGPKLTISVVRKERNAIASIVTLLHNTTVVYKYGCSDLSHNRRGGFQLLFWRAIQRAKNDGLTDFDLGRSDCDAVGLIAFKERWGSARSALTYWNYSPVQPNPHNWNELSVVRNLVRRLPIVALTTAGRLLYKHAG